MYVRDRDRRLRGVGAIASVDAVRRRGRPLYVLGDTKTAGGGNCYIQKDGVYYVQRADGRFEKASEREARMYPQCAGSTSTGYPATSEPRKPPKASGQTYGPSYGTQPPPAQTRASSPPPSNGSGGRSQQITTVDERPRTPPSEPTSYPEGSKKPTPPPSSSGATSTSSTSSGSSTTTTTTTSSTKTTAPTYKASTGASSVWVPPSTSAKVTFLPPPEPLPEIPEIPEPEPKPASIDKKTLLWVGAGIGLLLLLSRD